MDYIQAKNKIMTLWKEGGLAYERVRQEEYKKMYYAVLTHLKDKNQEWQGAIGDFLIHGTFSYDRFFEPRPKRAMSGQLKDAIFWLNMSVEALVEEFIQRVAKTKEMLAVIEGEEHKFDTAEAILAEQFPEMKGNVQWHDVVIHTSVFTKLKRAITLSGFTISVKEVTKKYSLVNAKRNALFHGRETEITVVDVDNAFVAYGWLKEHIG